MKWHGPFSYKVPSTADRSSIYVDWSEDHENAMQADIKSTIDSAVKEYLEIKNPEKKLKRKKYEG